MKNKGKKNRSGIVYSTDPDFDYDNPFAGLDLGGEDVQAETEAEALHDPLHLHLDRKGRKGKAVTLIKGFEGSDEALAKLGKALKSHCGVGGSTKDGEIILQGDQRDKAMAWLKKEGFRNVKKSGG